MNKIIPFFLFNITVSFSFTLVILLKQQKKINYINAFKKFCNHFDYICLYYRYTHYGISQRQHVYVIHSNTCSGLESNDIVENQRRMSGFFYFPSKYNLLSLLTSIRIKSHFPLKSLFAVFFQVFIKFSIIFIKFSLSFSTLLSWITENKDVSSTNSLT